LTLTTDWLRRFCWPETLAGGHKLAIAHRGASDYAPENTLKSFRIAAKLCAEMWELDVRLSSDGVCVVCHDDNLARISGRDLSISQSSWAQISAVPLPEGQHIPRLEEVIALAQKTGCGLYIEIKGQGAGVAAFRVLQEADFRFACLASFVVEWVAELGEMGCKYPLGVLVPAGVEPLQYLNGFRADIVHLCWRDAAAAPDKLLSDELVQSLGQYQIVLWDEDRIEIVDALLDKPVMGICSNRPELLKPYKQDPIHPIDIVCHRGANNIAPENTLEAAKICLDQRFQYVEVDVRTTADGELVVIHDDDLKRTTSGSGPVSGHTLAQIRALDAGSWFGQGASGQRVPTLWEFLETAAGRSGVYIEIKQANAKAVLEVVNAHNMLERCFFWSADISTLCDLRKLSADIALMAPRWVLGIFLGGGGGRRLRGPNHRV